MKKIMILGASILQLPAIKKAKEMGLEVVVVDMNPDAVGFQTEGIEKEIISTIDIPEIVKAAKRHSIDGIMTLATDMPMRAVAAVAKEMNLIGISADTAVKATNKAEMRKALKKAGVPIPEFYKVSTKEEYLEAVGKIKEAGYRCIIKPADNSGSRGIDLLKDYDSETVEKAYNYSKKSSRSGDLMVEEYMEGPEVSVETLSVNGVCHVIQITDKLTTDAPYFVEMGHSQPSGHTEEIKKQIAKVAIAANHAIGISNGPLDKIKLPVIIKATDLQGSNGIYIAKTEKDAYDGFHAAMGLTKRSYCIVEEFIEGWEFGAQAFVYNNEVLFVMPHGDETYMSHTAVPVGHYVPLDCDENIHEQTEEAVKNAIKALGLNNCAVNVDLILRDNKVYVIELTGRVGANCLPELVEINFGIEYYKMIAAMAVGENPLEYWNKRRETSKAGLARMILETEKEGILEEIEFNGCKDEDVLEVTFFKHQGDRVRVFENSNDCVGQVIVQGNNQKQCQDTLNEVLKNIRIKLK